jgi:hypothetical protein
MSKGRWKVREKERGEGCGDEKGKAEGGEERSEHRGRRNEGVSGRERRKESRNGRKESEGKRKPEKDMVKERGEGCVLRQRKAEEGRGRAQEVMEAKGR